MSLSRKFILKASVMPVLLIAFLSASSPVAFANAERFMIKDIQFEGLEGISRATALSYLSVKTGQWLDMSETSRVITDLYNSGFFSDVRLSRQNNTLMIHVTERSVIADIIVSGNTLIDTDRINNALKEAGLTKGQIFDQTLMEQVTKSLQSAYDAQGRYNASITADVIKLPRHRVNIRLNISEGQAAIVKSIHILGHQAFNEKELINTLALTTTRWNSFYTHQNHYTKEAFQQSLANLTDYYFDQGYLHFQIDSAHAVLSPDRQSITLVIHITEGKQYQLSHYELTGQLILPMTLYQELPELRALKTGEIFSRQKIIAASTALQKALDNAGYAFSHVTVTPIFNETNQTVNAVFTINPGQRVYVRHIHFKGNKTTSDQVLRSALTQLEGSVYSAGALETSEHHLNRLGFFSDIKENTVPVPQTNNQVDLNYEVVEQPSAQVSAGLGYSTDGLMLNAGVNESNFLGTGKQVGVNFANSVYQRSYGFNYNNPYYTPEGVQRGFSIYNLKTNPGKLNLAPYEFSEYGASVIYSIPFGIDDSYQIGIGLQRTSLSEGVNPSQQIDAFLKNEGDTFNQTMLTLGWTRNKLDRLFFPTSGTYQNVAVQVSAPLVGSDLNYYKMSYQFKGYYPMGYGFIGTLTGNFGYGKGFGSTQGLPFFANYYAGGLTSQGQVRGFETSSLGLKDSTGLHPYGGNALITASAQILLPKPFASDTFRTGVFVDAGQVYNTWNVYNLYPSEQTGIHLGDLRYSTGLDFTIRVPVFNTLLEFAIAKPLNSKPEDKKQVFSFNIGTNF